MAQLLLLLSAFGFPLSWHKTVSSEVNTWLGFQVNPCGPVVDFPMYKKTTLGSLLNKIISGNTCARALELGNSRFDPLPGFFSIYYIIPKYNPALMTQPQTGGELVMLVHTQWTGPTFGDG